MPDGTNIIIGKTPGWLDGYVPPAAEWNAWWAQKLDVSDPFVTQGPYLRLAGGTMTGPMVLFADPTVPLAPATKAYTDTADALRVLKAGDTMTGPLVLPGNPTTALQAATKAYADTKLALAGGTLTGPLVLAADPVGVLEAATKQYVDAHVPAGAPFLSLSGGTMTGPLILAGDPTVPLGAATKQYTDATAASAAASAPFVPLTQKAAALGVATLDATGHVPTAQLPGSATGTPFYKGSWNPVSNTPTLGNGGAGGVANDYYVASITGTSVSIDGLTTWTAGDWIINSGTVWQKISMSAGAFLPLAGGALTLPGTITGIGGLTFTSLDSFTPTSNLIPDAAEVWLDNTTGNIAIMLDRSGVFTVASLVANTATLTNANVTLVADPTVNLAAATKQYVDALRSNSLPLAPGTANAGTALTLSRSDHTHPADPTRAPINAPVFTTSVTLDGDTWIPSIEPDIIWSLRDTTNGNIVVWLDSSGAMSVASLIANNLSAVSLSGLNSLSATGATFSFATIAGETINDQTYPDLIGTVMGTNGNVVSGYDVITGEFNAVSVNAGAVKINGAPLNTAVQTAPSDSIDIRSAPYNGQGDGVRNHGYVTTSGSLLTITNFTGTLSLTVVDPTTARLDIVGATWSGWAFQGHHEGKLLYLVVGAYTLLARVKPHGYISGTSVLLDTTGLTVTPQTGATGSLTCPAVDTSKPTAGKVLIVEGMGRGQWWQQTPTLARQTDTVTPYGVQTWYTKTLASFTSPNSITITGTFPFNWTNQASVVLWGTDDSASAIQLGFDIWPLKKRAWFGGDGIYLLPGLAQSNAGRPSLGTAPAGNPSALLNGCIWAGDNASAYAITTGGQRMPNRISPASAPRYNDTPKMVHGRLSFPRCAQIPAGQTINVLFEGDSLGVYNPQGQLAAVMGAMRFTMEFIAQNPGKKINFYNTAVGGSTWASVASPAGSYNSASGNPYKFFTIPKPISGTVHRYAFWSNINQTGVGPPIVPDLIVMFNNAGNDKLTCDGNSMHSVVNQIRNVAHGDAYGPTDFVMQTDHLLVYQVYGEGPSGGSVLPGYAAAVIDAYYNTGFNRTTALNMQFPLIDYVPIMDRQVFGYDATRRAMRQVPQVTLTPGPGATVAFGEECLDFGVHINMTGAASDAAGWTNAQQIEFGISPHPGNRLYLRLGPNGHIWAAASTYGRFVDTVVTCDPASHTITLGAATSYAANCTFRGGWPQIDCPDSTVVFDSSMNGQCVIANTGNYDSVATGRPLQRNWIRAVMNAGNAMTDQINADGSDVVLTPTLPILIGPNQFIPQDTFAQPDVSIIFPDGTIWQTQVAYNGYVSATQATLVDAPPQTLTAQTVSMFLGRLGMQWFDTGIIPNSTTNIGYVALSVVRGDFQIGYIPDPSTMVQQVYAFKTLERFGGLFNPTLRSKVAQQMTLVNRWIDDDIPIAASTPGWYMRGIIDGNSDYFQGGTAGHYGSMIRTAVLDTVYAHQNLSVN